MSDANRLVAMCVALAACEAGAPKPDCQRAVNAILDVAGAKHGAATAQARHALITRCGDDKWTAAATICIRVVKTDDELRTCKYKHLTGAQTETLEAATRSLTRSGPR